MYEYSNSIYRHSRPTTLPYNFMAYRAEVGERRTECTELLDSLAARVDREDEELVRRRRVGGVLREHRERDAGDGDEIGSLSVQGTKRDDEPASSAEWVGEGSRSWPRRPVCCTASRF